jgi:eukaryotic-like serine/threonine-protein kinase
MNRDRWRDVSRIYGAVLTKAPDAREMFLRDACKDDPELRREVESLLKDHGSLMIDGSASQVTGALKVQTLTSGAQLGPHRIESVIGAGGMGQVYRATDTRLSRRVAIKVLPSELADDPQFQARFEREAKAIASLNHPHICTLYDVGRDHGIEYLVMEYLEGESLASRLERGALPFDQALECAIEIAAALAAAHHQGIVHRDLKPGNVMLTKSGAKLLDFGLAKTTASLGPTGRLSMLPTTPPIDAKAGPLTAQGTILGTFQYMAPEQLEGNEADQRTDIFAFGAIVYEMLTGKKAFDGKSQASVIASIMHAEPPAIVSAQPLTPPSLERAIRTCLAKNPDDRWQSARDLLRELKWIASASATETETILRTRRSRGGARLAWTIAALLGAAVVALAISMLRGPQDRATTDLSAVQFNVFPPGDTRLGGPAGGGSGSAAQLAISPDGKTLAFIAMRQNDFSVWVRPLGSLSARSMPGTEGATFPFWSFDSRFVAFFAGGKLKKVPAAGGPPVTICDAPDGRSGSWNSENVIVFGALRTTGIMRVGASGGVPVAVTEHDRSYGEVNHRFPFFLPDGRHFLYSAVTGAYGAAAGITRVKLGDLGSHDTRTLIETESSAIYSDGHLLFLREGTLMAQPIDLKSLKLQSEPFAIAEQISSEGSRYGSFSASSSGTLVYANGASTGSQLTWFDRAGKEVGVVGELGVLGSVALSPDEHHALVTRTTANLRDLWTYDLETGISRKLTFGPLDSFNGIWSPDGRSIAYQSASNPNPGMWVMSANGGAKEPVVTSEGPYALPNDWSRDGRFIAFLRGLSSSLAVSPGQDVWAVPTFGDRKPFPLTQTPFTEDAPAFSPDGRWIAYSSNEAGQGLPQVLVQRFPTTDEKSQVSRTSGGQPVWSHDGKEIFFLTSDSTLMVASYTTTPTFQASSPRPLFQSRAINGAAGRATYAVTRDGQRFLVASRPLQSPTAPFTVVTNWLATVQK